MPGIDYSPEPNRPKGINPVLCWGHNRLPKQKYIAVYTLCANRQRPLAGAMRNAVFNTARRVRGQVLYVAPPFVVAYLSYSWMEKRNKFLNSKEGRLKLDIAD